MAVCIDAIDSVLSTLSFHPSQEDLKPLQKQVAQYLRDNDYFDFLESTDDVRSHRRGCDLIERCKALLGDGTENLRSNDESIE